MIRYFEIMPRSSGNAIDVPAINPIANNIGIIKIGKVGPKIRIFREGSNFGILSMPIFNPSRIRHITEPMEKP